MLQSPLPVGTPARPPAPASPSLTEVLMGLPTPAPEFSLEMHASPGAPVARRSPPSIGRIREVVQRAALLSHDLTDALSDLAAALEGH